MHLYVNVHWIVSITGKYFTFRFQSWRQYSIVRELYQRFQECQHEKMAFATLNTNPTLYLAFLTICIIWRVKVPVLLCSSLYFYLWIVLCYQYLNRHMICRLLPVLFPVLFHIAEVRTCWNWKLYCLHLAICWVINFSESLTSQNRPQLSHPNNVNSFD